MQIPLFAATLPDWVDQCDYRLCDTEESVREALSLMQDPSLVIALDTETTGLKVYSDTLVGISLSHEIGTSFYFPIAHRTSEPNLDPSLVTDLIFPFLRSRPYIFHNAQFDTAILSKSGVNVKAMFDTLFVARVLDFRRNNRLKPLAENVLGLDVIELEDLVASDDFRFDLFDPSYCYKYACQDADLTLRLYNMFKDQDKVIPYINKLEMDIIPVVANMELTGFPVDFEKAKQHHTNTKTELKALESQIYSYAGMSFNIGSSDQLKYVLFDRLGLTPTRETDTGKVSTGEDALKDIENLHGIVPLLLRWRELNKMDSSFYKPYFDRITELGESRIYSRFNPSGARTGRFSSSNVNMQQVSKAIKEIFIPEDGYYLVEADYSQIEYRIFASMCKDPFMMQAIFDGRDMHEATADRLRPFLGLSPDELIPSEIRDKAKTLNFSVLFGSGDKNVSTQLGCSVEDARILIEEYYRQFSTVADWKEQMHMNAIELGYCETKFGRRRQIPELQVYTPELYEFTKTGLPWGTPKSTKKKFYRLLHGLRVAINTPVQGTAADIFKVALRRLHKKLLSQMDVKLHAVVHDSFILSVHKSINPEELCSKIKDITEVEIPDYVPIIMDVKYGYNWKTMKSLSDFKEDWDG